MNTAANSVFVIVSLMYALFQVRGHTNVPTVIMLAPSLALLNTIYNVTIVKEMQ